MEVYVLLEDNAMLEIMECLSCLVRPCSLLRLTIFSWTILSNHVKVSLEKKLGADDITNLAPNNDLGATIDDDDHGND
jgi:hypothetical protein